MTNLSRYDHRDWFTDPLGNMEFVEAYQLALLHVHSSFGHDAQTALRHRGDVLVETEDVRLLLWVDLKVSDAAVTLMIILLNKYWSTI